ncbi:hypothetical protein TNCV_3149901 [Trichonephila clavipes]|nr:hypothetical protein TNCV_3149901 [Trichonephila clavipes]
MTIATLKDLIISSEDYDEELTKNIHSTIVEDRKVREENLRIEEQKKKKENYALKNEKKKITLRTIETKLRPKATGFFSDEELMDFEASLDTMEVDADNLEVSLNTLLESSNVNTSELSVKK